MFTIDRLGGYLLALLGNSKLKEYEVTLMDDVGNLFVEYVLADGIEAAAFNAFELSSQRDCLLKDVRMTDEW